MPLSVSPWGPSFSGGRISMSSIIGAAATKTFLQAGALAGGAIGVVPHVPMLALPAAPIAALPAAPTADPPVPWLPPISDPSPALPAAPPVLVEPPLADVVLCDPSPPAPAASLPPAEPVTSFVLDDLS